MRKALDECAAATQLVEEEASGFRIFYGALCAQINLCAAGRGKAGGSRAGEEQLSVVATQ